MVVNFMSVDNTSLDIMHHFKQVLQTQLSICVLCMYCILKIKGFQYMTFLYTKQCKKYFDIKYNLLYFFTNRNCYLYIHAIVFLTLMS